MSEEIKEPKILFVVISEDANTFQTFDGSKIYIFNPITIIKKKLPYKLRASVSIGFLDFYLPHDNILKIELADPDDDIIFEISEQLFSDLKKRNTHVQGNFGFSFEEVLLEKPGDYSLKLYLDGIYLGGQTIRVFDQGKEED